MDQHRNRCLIGGSGTGEPHPATALGLALCRAGRRVRLVTAAGLATEPGEAQQQHRLDRLLTALDRLDTRHLLGVARVVFTNRSGEVVTHRQPVAPHRDRIRLFGC